MSTPPDKPAAFAEQARLYARVDEAVTAIGTVCINRGICCDFDKVDHILYATDLEIDYLIEVHGPPPRPAHPNQCPYQVDGMCAARAARPIGCRTYFCDPTGVDARSLVYEQHYALIKKIQTTYGYSHRYSPLLLTLAQHPSRSQPPH